MHKPQSIRFLRDFRVWKRGCVSSEIARNVQELYVMRGIAEWHEPKVDQPRRRKHEPTTAVHP